MTDLDKLTIAVLEAIYGKATVTHVLATHCGSVAKTVHEFYLNISKK